MPHIGTKEIRQRISTAPVVAAAGNKFWKRTKPTLTEPGFRQLMISFRAVDLGRSVRANIDVIDLGKKQVVAINDFVIFGDEYADIYQLVIIPPESFSLQAQKVLLEAGFTADQFEANRINELHWTPGQLAFWIRGEYRKQNDPNFCGLSQVLMSTAARIIKGLGVNTIKVTDIGDRLDGSRQKLMNHYQSAFGAEVENEVFGEMIIRI